MRVIFYNWPNAPFPSRCICRKSLSLTTHVQPQALLPRMWHDVTRTEPGNNLVLTSFWFKNSPFTKTPVIYYEITDNWFEFMACCLLSGEMITLRTAISSDGNSPALLSWSCLYFWWLLAVFFTTIVWLSYSHFSPFIVLSPFHFFESCVTIKYCNKYPNVGIFKEALL